MHPNRLEAVKIRQTSQSKKAEIKYHVLDIEIDDHGEAACSTGICEQYPEEIKLFRYSEIPDFLKGNPWVIDGYRVFLPFGLCVKSLFVWNNETLNIWSHLIGFLVFLVLTLYDNLIAIPHLRGETIDHIYVTIALLCFQFCMLCSTGFHIFCCHSERASRRWLQVDMTGVSIGIIGCYMPAVHYAFYCISIWRDIYILAITVLTVSTLWFQLHPYFFTARWYYLRMAVYVGLAGYGIVPTIHWVYLSGGFSSKIVQAGLTTLVPVINGGILSYFWLSCSGTVLGKIFSNTDLHMAAQLNSKVLVSDPQLKSPH
ncbi:hypothetical protein C0Q70_00274 [Pomacea canaliculata]|uniref:Progestin and adipoQ receptor family member III n=1 Tax=Pomacea canaliculata TaxID=400727 RepID=A0A2T7PW64_POMCA|nr:hypothetical protein C0Q70_00274 [Pomacea canaliculata]